MSSMTDDEARALTVACPDCGAPDHEWCANLTKCRSGWYPNMLRYFRRKTLHPSRVRRSNMETP